ncbi:C4-dicarboxylic acid transporter DauA [Cellvibrio japonicus]|uniref:Sulfate permease family protein n=1 Tax=Cellvibrio japonicus (strain Ueda107) TaxID=498211 RepID=B3PBT5_CELJU|nr:C4-dicarboxylic acid transporter DauA [Cellvibrio japonicus]ACE85990.1 sulfate permease family protein [Cellvibrio japonicus Ueda107]QEI11752.1 C4-dicarboxylic acid transporter DauA [Cellvibrio japonicus]QEI15326.1 C4-dicarboxylic acid transporter DauA [Cellvibrio japonicus]QEI18906.1 C4-dicarboxylic acid transporter DauA [Cellvibrio japonicus]
MPHRAHLFSLRPGHAVREACVREPYNRKRLTRDLLAGLTVGVIAIPLAMALAVASGVPPQYGLYTAIIAGFLIPLLGGSRFSISGPTAAFVVILYPVAQKYGLGGLLVASVMAGGILVIMALLRLGRLIEYIPEAVTLGFTGGIAIVIATLQIKDMLGLDMGEMPEHYIDKLWLLFSHLSHWHWPSVAVAVSTLMVMLAWPHLKWPVPPHLPALLLGTLVALLLAQAGYGVDTIGSRFSYLLPDGSHGAGIPSQLPEFEWPWLQAGADGLPLRWSWQLFQDLLAAAFAIAMLGAIESLLCAVVLDGMTGKRHSANSELLGQGIANMVTPFFGGITATAALARSAANVRAGAESPVAGMVHALVVLLGLVSLAPLLAYIPMAAMAALLVMVAWGMSEAHKAVHLLRTAPRGDIWVFVACLGLTVLFDMVIAITVGIVLAALLFMKEIAAMTHAEDITTQATDALPEHWRVFKITGPLFFAAADRVFGELSTLCTERQHIVLSLKEVSLLDAGGLAALNKLIDKCRHNQTELILTDIPPQPLNTLAHADIKPIKGALRFYLTLEEARRTIIQDNAAA